MSAENYDLMAQPLAGPDINGERRLDYLGQMLTDDDIINRSLARHPGIDTAAVIRWVETSVPDFVETVGDWVDWAADHVAAEQVA